MITAISVNKRRKRSILFGVDIENTGMVGAADRSDFRGILRQIEALRGERANHLANVRRVLDWLDDPRRKPAENAFTEGPERQLAYRFESMLHGEFICTKCGLRKNSEPPPASF